MKKWIENRRRKVYEKWLRKIRKNERMSNRYYEAENQIVSFNEQTKEKVGKPEKGIFDARENKFIKWR